MQRRECLAGIAAAALGAVLATPARAEAGYPAKPVRLLVGFPPGSAADVAARMLAQKLGELLGEQVVVENRPGAGSNIATEAVVRAPNDGYTLLLGTVANTINTSLYRNLPFRFDADLAPVALVGTVPNILVAHHSLGVGSVAELIALAKTRREPILYGSSGNGTSPHMSGELFNEMAGVKLVHVPYRGSSQAVVDLLAGRLGVMFSPASTVLPHIRDGTLKALASTGSRRAAALPDLPTIAESGLPGFETEVWFGVLAPAGTPADVIGRLAEAAGQALRSPELSAQFAAQGIDPLGGGPAEFARYIRSETEKWANVVRVSGATID